MSNVILKGYLLVPPADLPAVKQELPNHIRLTRKEAGCLVFEVSQDHENAQRFNVYEEFSSKEAFAAHQVRVRSSKWCEITAGMERYYEIECDGA